MWSVLWSPWDYRRQKQGHGRVPTAAKCSAIFFDFFGDSRFVVGFEPHTCRILSVHNESEYKMKMKGIGQLKPFCEQAVSN